MVKLRDVRRDEMYFSKGIDFKQKFINRNKEKDYPRPEGQALHVSELFDYSVHLLIQRYGRGDSLNSLQESIKQTVDMRKKMTETLDGFKLEHPRLVDMYGKLDLYNYYYTLTVLCFIIAVSQSANNVSSALRLFNYTGQDALLDKIFMLLGCAEPDEQVSKRLAFPKIYTLLMEAVDSKEEERSILIKKFVENWYKSIRPIAWHGNDKAAESAYFGYWCFEAALVVNLLNIDDSSFRDNIYYPKDLIIRT